LDFANYFTIAFDLKSVGKNDFDFDFKSFWKNDFDFDFKSFYK